MIITKMMQTNNELSMDQVLVDLLRCQYHVLYS